MEKKKHASIIKKEQAEKLRQKVMAFFRANPFATQTECAHELGVTTTTVNKHVAILKQRMREDMKV